MTPLGPTCQDVLSAITQAAELGKPCPSNSDLAKVAKLSAKDSVNAVIRKLESMGLITVERVPLGRCITVAKTGKSTAPVKRASERPKPAPLTARPLFVAQVVNRDPCFKCGVRGDIGCKHQPASLPTTIAETIRG